MTEKKKAPAWRAQQAKGFDCKDNYKTQYDKVLAAFSTPKTMLMVAKETGIERANICRFVSYAVRLGTLFLIGYNLCAITLHMAGYYSTDRTLAKIPIQLELFGEKGGSYEE